MLSKNEIAAPASAEHGTLYVAIEISGKSWVVGITGPTSERIGLHALGSADVEGLKDLIERQRAKGESALIHEVRVVCCYEASYEGFWLARWLDRVLSVETVVLYGTPLARVYTSAGMPCGSCRRTRIRWAGQGASEV